MQKQSDLNSLAPLERASLNGLEHTFAEAEKFYGYLPTYFLAMARLPAAVEAYTTFCTELYDEVTLPDGLAHLISLEASIAADCLYSMVHAAKKASDCGVSAEKIAAMPDYETSALFDARERAALAFARMCATAPSPLEKSDFEEMFKTFSETEVCEIVVIAAQTGFHNRWNDAVKTALEPEAAAFAQTIGWLRESL
ncbi:MAG: carboxymuconolactone decarboxylase family protein [Pseudomonadota bacterium]